VNLYIHSPIHLHGVVLNSLSTGTTLPFMSPELFHKCNQSNLLSVSFKHVDGKFFIISKIFCLDVLLQLFFHMGDSFCTLYPSHYHIYKLHKVSPPEVTQCVPSLLVTGAYCG
jgi:hypothetical protein